MLLRMLFRNAGRRPLRTALTVVAMTVAILAFCLLQTLVDAWYAGVAASSARRLVTRNAISLVFPLPLHYRERIRQVEGVTLVAHGNWFGGYYQDPKNFFANFAVEPSSYLALYPEYLLEQAERTAFLRDRKGAVVGRRLAERFGWRVGDPIPLKGTIFPGDWSLTVRAIYRGRDPTTDETLLFFHWDYLNETVKRTTPRRADQVGFYLVGVERPELAVEASATIDALFRSSSAETLTETEAAFQLGFVAMSETIVAAIRLVALVVIVIILAVVANTMAMSVRERLWEYAVLKTLGFGGTALTGLILGESLLLALTGGVLGVTLGFPVTERFAALVGSFFPHFGISILTLAQAVAASLAVGLVAALLPARQAVSVRIAEGLRRLG